MSSPTAFLVVASSVLGQAGRAAGTSPLIFIMLVVAAVPLIGLIALCIWKPIVLRVIARIVAVLASGAGVTGIVAGILFLCMGTTYFEEDDVIWILAGGSGLLVGGIIALVLSFVGRSRKIDDRQA